MVNQMTKVEELVKMLSSRIVSLTREAAKLSRMTGASTCPRQRSILRDKCRETRNKATMLQARLDKLTIEPNKQNEGVARHG